MAIKTKRGGYFPQYKTQIKHLEKVKKNLTEDIKGYANEVVARFANKLADELAEKTPKDTTHASINWIVRNDRSPGQEYGEPTTNWKRPPQPTIDELGTRRTGRLGTRKTTVQVMNVVPYVKAINDGTHPYQDPKLLNDIGFVNDTVAQQDDILNEIVKDTTITTLSRFTTKQ